MSFWIDTHVHLDAHELAADVAQVRERARAAGVGLLVIPAVEAGNFAAVRALAHRFGDSYALGIHPLCTGRATDDDLARLDAALTEHKADGRLVAVGEIGLDYFVEGLDADHQEYIYREQLKLARKHGLPVILHVRRSVDRVLKGLREQRMEGGIGHAFNGSEQQAAAFIKLGFKLGFGGALTYDRSLQIRRLAAALPLDALVMETDSPDIPPHWLYRTAEQRAGGLPQGRNEPAELPRIAQVLAGLREMPAQALQAAAMRNTLAALPRLASLCSALSPLPLGRGLG